MAGAGLRRRAAPENDASDRESSPLGESQASAAQPSPEDAILLEQVLEHALLMPVQPSGDEDGQDLAEGGHGARKRTDSPSPSYAPPTRRTRSPSSASRAVPRG